jgi:hypothetical protein
MTAGGSPCGGVDAHAKSSSAPNDAAAPRMTRNAMGLWPEGYRILAAVGQRLANLRG